MRNAFLLSSSRPGRHGKQVIISYANWYIPCGLCPVRLDGGGGGCGCGVDEQSHQHPGARTCERGKAAKSLERNGDRGPFMKREKRTVREGERTQRERERERERVCVCVCKYLACECDSQPHTTADTHAPRVREGCSRTYDSGIVPFTLSVPVVTLLSGEGRACVDGRTSV